MHQASAKLNIYSTFLNSKCLHLPPWMMWDRALSEHPVSATNILLLLKELGSNHTNKVARLCSGAALCLPSKSHLLEHCKCGSGWVQGTCPAAIWMCFLNHIIAHLDFRMEYPKKLWSGTVCLQETAGGNKICSYLFRRRVDLAINK